MDSSHGFGFYSNTWLSQTHIKCTEISKRILSIVMDLLVCGFCTSLSLIWYMRLITISCPGTGIRMVLAKTDSNSVTEWEMLWLQLYGKSQLVCNTQNLDGLLMIIIALEGGWARVCPTLTMWEQCIWVLWIEVIDTESIIVKMLETIKQKWLAIE